MEFSILDCCDVADHKFIVLEVRSAVLFIFVTISEVLTKGLVSRGKIFNDTENSFCSPKFLGCIDFEEIILGTIFVYGGTKIRPNTKKQLLIQCSVLSKETRPLVLTVSILKVKVFTLSRQVGKQWITLFLKEILYFLLLLFHKNFPLNFEFSYENAIIEEKSHKKASA